jgi:hypothetical protein
MLQSQKNVSSIKNKVFDIRRKKDIIEFTNKQRDLHDSRNTVRKVLMNMKLGCEETTNTYWAYWVNSW